MVRSNSANNKQKGKPIQLQSFPNFSNTKFRSASSSAARELVTDVGASLTKQLYTLCLPGIGRFADCQGRR